MRRTVLIALSLALCTLPAAGQAPKADPMRARLDKMAKDFADAWNRGDDKSVAAAYTEDAMVMAPDSELVKGRPAIEAFWGEGRKAGFKNMRLEVTDFESSGDYLIETGKAWLDFQPAGQAAATAQAYKYLVVWKKQADGSWKIHRDIWNSTPAPAAATPHH
jgi:uncharacterized protein (TIGR02246 family)